MRKSLVRVLGAVVGVAVALGVGSPAGAVTGLQGPLRVVLAGPVVSVPVTVVGRVPVDARGELFGVAVSVPDRDPAVIARTWEKWSSSQSVTVPVVARSAGLLLGDQVWEAEDFGDGTVSRIAVKVVRASRLSVGPLSVAAPGVVAGSVRVTHFDPVSGRWTGAGGSPVWVQSKDGAGKWTTVGSWVADASGVASGVAKVSPGAVVRFVRPEGARDGAVTSSGVLVR